MTPELELAWAAGIFEGEGTVTIGVRKSDETYRLICTVTNTDEQIIDLFHARWGGWKQPLYGERPGRKPGWSWTVAGPRAWQCIVDLSEFVRCDRVLHKFHLARLFREHQGTVGVGRWRPGYKDRQRFLYGRMRELNRRGSASA